jgi:Skp family chaperone for outer membrane proteins
MKSDMKLETKIARTVGMVASSRALGAAVLVGVAAFAATAGTRYVTAHTNAVADAPRVAVVNIEEVLNGLDYLKLEQGKLKNKADDRQKELTALANELDKPRTGGTQPAPVPAADAEERRRLEDRARTLPGARGFFDNK